MANLSPVSRLSAWQCCSEPQQSVSPVPSLSLPSCLILPLYSPVSAPDARPVWFRETEKNVSAFAAQLNTTCLKARAALSRAGVEKGLVGPGGATRDT